MKLSIVSTLYQSAPYIDEFYERSRKAAESFCGQDFEIILVNDGSPDNSLDLAVRLTRQDRRVVVVDLSRNFGHHKAMMTGLSYARGDLVYLIDSDLEEQPEWLVSFAGTLEKNDGSDVVFGVQENRKGGAFEKASGFLFWYLINRLSGLSLSPNQVTARLMTRRYVTSLLRHQEREVFMAGLWHITGFRQLPVTVQKLSSSPTTYTLKRKISLLVNSVTSFSSLPLAAIFYSGIAIFSFACLYTFYLIVNWLLYSYTVAGWTSVMVSIWIFGGLQLSAMGVIGIYLSKIFSESKQRPYSLVRDVYGRE